MPLIPWTNDRFGRRMSVFVGSIIMLVGAALQAGAQNGASVSVTN
jgi:MFS family permease